MNDRLYKAVSEDEWDHEANELAHILRLKGYREQYSNPPGFEYPSDNAYVWINWKKKKILILSYKARTEFEDRNGNILYEDDRVQYNDGFYKIETTLNAHPFGEGYYIREYLTHEGMCSRVRDTDIDENNIKYVTKIKDVLEFPKRNWNSPKIFDINTL